MSDCGKFKATFTEQNTMGASFREGGALEAEFGEVQKVSTSNYNELSNKPSINDVELKGNKSFDDLGDHTLTNLEIKDIFNKIFNKNGGN